MLGTWSPASTLQTWSGVADYAAAVAVPGLLAVPYGAGLVAQRRCFRLMGRNGRSGPVYWPWPVGWRQRQADTSSWLGSWLSPQPTGPNGSAGSAVGFAAGRREWSETACQPELFALFRQLVWRTLGTQEADTSNGSCEDSLLARERIVAARNFSGE